MWFTLEASSQQTLAGGGNSSSPSGSVNGAGPHPSSGIAHNDVTLIFFFFLGKHSLQLLGQPVPTRPVAWIVGIWLVFFFLLLFYNKRNVIDTNPNSSYVKDFI